MTVVSSYQEVLDVIAGIRNLRKGFVTNFFPDEFKVGIWVKHNQLYVNMSEDSALFIVDNDGFKSIYFASSSFESFQEQLANIDYDCCILDYIARGSDTKVEEFFTLNGFKKYSALYRMSRITPASDADYSVNANLRNATVDDISQILSYFHEHFDKYVEQIPVEEELCQWTHLGHIIVYEEKGEIGGFLIYDQAPASWYLRYWFVSPEYRDKKVGSSLIKEGMHRGTTSKRQMFWVIETNDNAIKRYEHYGYKRESMYDTIYMLNK